jgi:HlyD family secretion protein
MSEVLTEDALRLAPGSVVELIPGGGRPELTAHVKKIEPAGFTKLSSLGVEQKRVRVLARLSPVPSWLGAGYRLQARFVTGEKEKALLVDRFSVLQDPQGKSYVFKVVNGKLVRQDVELGLRGELEYEVLSGLTASDRIVKVPDPATTAGGEVTPVQ